MREIRLIQKYKKEEIKKYLYEYLTELSQFDPDIKFDKMGFPTYKWFDYYWTENGRFPFYLIINGEIAGFAFVRELNEREYEIAEFYILPKFRKDGNALWFAGQIISLFSGEICISTRHTNLRGVNFWSKVVNMFETFSSYDNEVWKNWKITKG